LSRALGDRLREAREARGLSIEQLAAITKLNPQFIEALESGRRDLLPGQVYLKPFTKSCAEALGLDLKELYRIINGESEEKTGEEIPAPDLSRAKKGLDYRLPLVIIIGLIIIGLIYLTVSSRKARSPDMSDTDVVPAETHQPRREAKWNRPWERPAAWEGLARSQRLRIEVSDLVWINVVADGDTTYTGFLNPGAGRTFTAREGFALSLGRNDCVTGYFNGEKIAEIGTSVRGLFNYRLGAIRERQDVER
jgi:transcriptional regulator with XRE-family HTH domain